MYSLPLSQKPSSGWSVANGIPGGLSGGIPDTSSWTVYDVTQSPYNADNTGVTDASTAINAAITAAGIAHRTGAIIYLPTGTYRIEAAIDLSLAAKPAGGTQEPYSMVLRGDGKALTIIDMQFAGSGNGISMAPKVGWTGGNKAIASGYTRGSASIVLVDTPEAYVSAGIWIRVSVPNIDVSDLADIPGYMVRTIGQIVRVTSVDSGTKTINFEPALNVGGYALTNATIQYGINPAYNSGLEDFKIQNSTGNGTNSIFMVTPLECWINGVESENAKGWHIRAESAAGCIFTDNFLHEGYGGGGNSIYGIGLYGRSCNNYAYNNIAEHCRHSYITEYGGQGNVIAYNYSKDPINEGQLETSFLMGDLVHHGGSPRFNLWEGNVSATLKWDNVLGSQKNNTAFRSQMTRKSVPDADAGNFAIDLQENSRDGYVVGSVAEDKPATSSDPAVRLGVAGDGGGPVVDNDALRVDPDGGTTVIHGFYSVETDDTEWNLSDDQDLPDSFYLTAKPSWWDGEVWPSIGPDLTEKFGANPAYRRVWGVASIIRTSYASAALLI